LIYGENLDEIHTVDYSDFSTERIVGQILQLMTPRLRRLMECRMDEKPTREIAAEFGVCRERILQLGRKAHDEFKALLATHFPDVTLNDLGLR